MSEIGRISIERFQAECERMDALNSQTPSELSPVDGSAWVLVADRLPELGQIVWLHNGQHTWIGSRDDSGDDGWLWGNSYGHIWHNGTKWDGECEQDDDYKPSHWMPLPTPPNEKLSRPAAE